jgi:hypothetical protein
LDKWDVRDKGYTQDEWLIRMIERRWKGRNTDVLWINFAMDSREGLSKFFKGVI